VQASRRSEGLTLFITPGQSYNAGMNKGMALVRVALGLTQVMAATVTLYFLVQTGMSNLTTVATVVTLLLVVVSKLLFGRLDRKD
jgi:hypothetical protein